MFVLQTTLIRQLLVAMVLIGLLKDFNLRNPVFKAQTILLLKYESRNFQENYENYATCKPVKMLIKISVGFSATNNLVSAKFAYT